FRPAHYSHLIPFYKAPGLRHACALRSSFSRYTASISSPPPTRRNVVMVQSAPVQVLIVEDNPGDVELARVALGETTLPLAVHVASDGEEAMRFLRQQGEFDDAPTPDLVLLDLNMPKMGGLEVLDRMKADEDLRFIPV